MPRLTIMPSSPAQAGMARHRAASYYFETRSDYRLWSRRLNMHFGFWRPGMDPTDREAMLEQMNVEVVNRLRLGAYDAPVVADLGCGAGTVARTLARQVPGSRPVGLTAVAWQAAQAARLAREEAEPCPPIVLGDFTAAPFLTASFDGVYALESSCYAPALSKRALLEEMARLTGPGGRMVVADAMLKRRRIRAPVTHAAHRALCRTWALETLGHLGTFIDTAAAVGFDDIVVEDISFNVLPSVLHVPGATLRFAAAALSGRGANIAGARWRNACAGFPLALFAADLTAGGYYLVSATRRS